VQRCVVVPIVNDAFHHVQLRAARYFAEEVAAHDRDTIGDAGLLQRRVRTRADCRQIEKDAACIAAGAEHRTEEPAMPAADVSDRAKAREVVSCGDRRDLLRGVRGHRRVEAVRRRAFGLRAQVLAERAQLEAPTGQLSHDPKIR
jgi:hypothetical protein